jgi:hypothetical protein
VAGRPRIVDQVCLDAEDEVLARLTTLSGRTRPTRARHTITRMPPTHQRLYMIFDLDRYARTADVGNTPN